MPKRPRSKKGPRAKQGALETVPEKPSYIIDIEKILFEAQKDSKLHSKYSLQLNEIYNKVPVDEFNEELRKYMRFLFTYEESTNTRTALDFVAFFINSGNNSFENTESQDDENEPEMHPLFKFAIDTAIEVTTCDNVTIRLNAILFITKVLATMGENATIDDDLFKIIIFCFIDRLQDVSSKVRQYAVEACKRLQQPGDDDDPVIKTYLFHVKFDTSHHVRKAVLKCIHNRFIYNQDIINCVADSNENVRLQVYMRYEKAKLERLKIADRQKILRRGLLDPDKRVSKYVSTQLLWSWITYCNDSVVKLLNLIRLDTTPRQKEDYNRVVKKIIQVLIEKKGRDIITILPFKPETKLLNLADISLESMLLWKAIVEYFHRLKQVDEVLPETKAFVELYKTFREFRILDPPPPGEENIIKTDYENTCLHFYNIMMFFEVDDEVGREYLVETLLNILKNERPPSDHVKVIVNILKKFMIKFDYWHDTLVDIINDVYEPVITNTMPPPPPPNPVPMSVEENLLTESMHELELKRNDGRLKYFALEEEKRMAITEKNYKRAEEIENEITELTNILKKLETPRRKTLAAPVDAIVDEVREITKDIEEHKYALKILHAMLTLMDENTPTIHMLRESMLLPYLRTEDPHLLRLLIICIGSMSLADMAIASQYFVWLYSKVFDPRQIIWESTLKMIFDIFRRYGMEDFNYVPERANNVTLKRRLYTENTKDGNMEDQTTLNSDQTTGISDQATRDSGLENNAYNFINVISQFLQSSDLNKRALAVSGLVKLYLHKQISSKTMLARLMVLWFHPDSSLEQNNKMSQQIGLLFSELAEGRSLGQEALAEILIPVLKMLLNAPSDSSLSTISLDDVIKLVADLSKPNKNSTINVHNTLVLQMCSKLKGLPTNLLPIEIQAYTKTLSLCAACVDDEEIRVAAIKCCTDLLKKISEKTTIRNIEKAIAILKGSTSQISNTIQTENRTRTLTPGHSTSTTQNIEGDEAMEDVENERGYESEPLFSEEEE